MGLNIELIMGSDDDDNMDHEGPKNTEDPKNMNATSAQGSARLSF